MLIENIPHTSTPNFSGYADVGSKCRDSDLFLNKNNQHNNTLSRAIALQIKCLLKTGLEREQ